ncbi:MAG TPA: phytoene/squalene synthase family protein [Planctomycetaceae bacterium]|nr:phytoene/squalene synthase family protein [Planctomycetaceae bacterium]
MLGLPLGSSRTSCGLALAAGTMSGADAGESGNQNAVAASLADSYAWCRRCTRQSRSNFYVSFLTLPRILFRDMCVLYAFMRVSDDLGDDATIPAQECSAAIDRWRAYVAQGLDGGRFEHPALPALTDVVRRHGIPREYLFDVIDGVQSDLAPRTFETFAEVSDYCYHVAGAVGLCCLHIWGFSDPRAKGLAIDCGLAFQLTNILRDVAEDARVGRYYLPREDLRRFGLTIDDLRTGNPSAPFRELMAWEAARAQSYFARAEQLVPLCNPAGRPILDAMLRTYAALLGAIEASDFDVHARRIKVGLGRKLRIALGSLWRCRRARE